MSWSGGSQKKNSYITRRAREGWSSDEFATPWPLVRWLEAELGRKFDLDPAATQANAKAPFFLTKAEDGLAQPWGGVVFVNPPFSSIADWIDKAIVEAEAGALVAMIVPVRGEQNWWHDLVLPYAEIWFQRGRQRFIDPTGTDVGRPVFASAILIYRPGLPTPGKLQSVPSIRDEPVRSPLEAVLR